MAGLSAEDRLLKQSSFASDGFSVFPGFLSEFEVGRLEGELRRLVGNWQVSASRKVSFSTTEGSSHASEEYFRKSGDNISWFLEESAVERIKGASDQELDALSVDEKMGLINKGGHAFHTHSELFRHFLEGPAFMHVMRALWPSTELPGLEVVQSMFICKPPKIGGAVLPHQDETYVTPTRGSCVAFWIALDDATAENGCLQVLPGSHKYGVGYYSVHSPATDAVVTTKDGDPAGPELKEKVLPAVPGAFIPVPARRGDLIVFDGRLIHASEPNTSNAARHAMTFHCVRQDVPLTPHCWLQAFGHSRCVLGCAWD